MAYLEIVLKSDLCVGNGSSSGNAIDQDICMNEAGIPYIPARRLKGCLRESAKELLHCGYEGITANDIDSLFGNAYGENGKIIIEDAKIKGSDDITRWLFSVRRDLHLSADYRRMAHPANIVKAFSEIRGQTKMEQGVKVDNSLRFKRVLNHYNPLENYEKELSLFAPIYILTGDDTCLGFLKDCFKATRHIGMNRNRGLGNVEIIFHEDDALVPVVNVSGTSNQGSENVQISYMIELLSEVTLPGCEEMMTMIPARSVIGAMAATYLGDRDADRTFEDLFLSGKVKWSALTPVINGMISGQVPNYVMKLKNFDDKIVNVIAEEGNRWKALKPKTMEGCYLVTDKTGVSFISASEVRTQYHNSKNGVGLYVQDSIPAGMIYGGTVEVPSYMQETVLHLLEKCNFRFGRSKNAQYSTCRLYKSPVVEARKVQQIETHPGEDIFLVLQTDMALMRYGISVTEPDEVKAILGEMLAIEGVDDGLDSCTYHTIGGFQTKWQLQKPQVNVVKAGSVYHFRATTNQISETIQVGEFQQEGFGRIRVVTKKQLMGERVFFESEIDQREIAEGFDEKKRMEVLLLTMAGRDAMKRYAREFRFDMAEGEELPAGRLRMMVAEAKDLSDLVKRIDSIKTSDVSSENPKGHRDISKQLVEQLYGLKQIDLSRLLPSDDNKLSEAILNNEKAREMLLAEWKVPVIQFLHEYHYMK